MRFEHDDFLGPVALIQRLKVDAFKRSRGCRRIDARNLCDTLLTQAKAQQFKRLVFSIGGFPASGKTTLAKHLADELNTFVGSEVAKHIPFDGFHLSQAVLKSRGLDKIKGYPATYDLRRFASAIAGFRESVDAMTFPDYDRAIGDVSEEAIEVSRDVRVLITEGIYLTSLLGDGQAEPWARLIDGSVFLDTSPATCVSRIIARNRRANRSDEEIFGKILRDLDFMRFAITHLGHVDWIVSGNDNDQIQSRETAEGPDS